MIIPIDKQLHFTWSFVFACLFTAVHPLGWLVALGFGVGKEIYDLARNGKLFLKDSISDMIFNILGVAFFMLIKG